MLYIYYTPPLFHSSSDTRTDHTHQSLSQYYLTQTMASISQKSFSQKTKVIVYNFGNLSEETNQRLSEFNRYLMNGPHGVSSDLDRLGILAVIYRANNRFRKRWEATEKLCTLDDPCSIVFLYVVWRSTEEWFKETRQVTKGKYSYSDHSSMCLFLMYILYGFCTTYPASSFYDPPFSFVSGPELIRYAMRIILDTDLSRLYRDFFRTEEVGYIKTIQELSSW